MKFLNQMDLVRHFAKYIDKDSVRNYATVVCANSIDVVITDGSSLLLGASTEFDGMEETTFTKDLKESGVKYPKYSAVIPLKEGNESPYSGHWRFILGVIRSANKTPLNHLWLTITKDGMPSLTVRTDGSFDGQFVIDPLVLRKFLLAVPKDIEPRVFFDASNTESPVLFEYSDIDNSITYQHVVVPRRKVD